MTQMSVESFELASYLVGEALDKFQENHKEIDDLGTISVFLNIMTAYLKDSVPEEVFVDYMAQMYSLYTSDITKN